jgi:DNA recombination protein RmuC
MPNPENLNNILIFITQQSLQMSPFLYLLIGALVGALIGYFAARSKQSALEAQSLAAATEAARLGEELAQLKSSVASLTNQSQEAEKRASVAEANRVNAEQRLAEADVRHRDAIEKLQKELTERVDEVRRQAEELMAAKEKSFNETTQRLTAEMQSATQEMLRQRQKEFEQSSNTSLGHIVNPLREAIDAMKRRMEENTARQTEIGAAMQTNVEHMIRQSEAARASAEELTRVFKHGSKVQGDWGETVLKELLDAQGLTEGVHYDTQAVIRDKNGNVVKSEEGAMMRPDVILHLDQTREVIIDSKVSLTAFINYVNAETDEERAAWLKAHIDSLTKHVRELARKDYSSYIQPPKCKTDYVIMFVPHSGALWTALHEQPDLWRRSMEQGVYIADEQTLYAALRIIALTWQQITQAQNHEQVFKLANEIIDRVGFFAKYYDDLGKALTSARAAYDTAGKKLKPSGQSILVSCDKLLKLGAKQSSKYPLKALTDPELPEIEGGEEEKI